MQVLTNKGFKNFEGIINQGIKSDLIKIVFDDNTNIVCTYDHEFYDGEEFLPACFFEIGDYLDSKKIISILEHNDEEVYDLYDVEDTHSYTTNGVESHNCNFLYLDEFAFVPRNIQEDFFTSVYPTIISGTNTKVAITSTPNGFDLFYKIWTNSIENRNEYANFSVNWWDVPGRDEVWKQKTISNTSEDQFRQEFEAEFLGSTNTLISPNILRSLTFKNPISTYYGGNLSVYEEPKKDATYFCVVDTSRGTGQDASAFIIFDTSKIPYNIVATYADAFIDPILYPEIIYSVAKNYNNAFTLIEINDNGQQIADILHQDLEYENVVFTTVKGRKGQIIGGGFSATIQKGVRTTKQVKRIGCANAKTIIEKDQIILNDYLVVNELSTFVRKNDSYEAEMGSHDDLVMCIVLFAWATTQQFFKEITDTDVRKKLLENRERLIEDEILPFGIIDDGQSLETEKTINTYDIDNDFANKWGSW